MIVDASYGRERMKDNPKDCLNCKKAVCDDCKDDSKQRKDYYKGYYRRRKVKGIEIEEFNCTNDTGG